MAGPQFSSMWSNTVLDVSMRIFLDEIDFLKKKNLFMFGCVRSKLRHLGSSLCRAGSFTEAHRLSSVSWLSSCGINMHSSLIYNSHNNPNACQLMGIC